MSKALRARLARLETPDGREPTIGDWLDWLDAADGATATADLVRRFPIVGTADYVAPFDKVALARTA